ncbi:MAG: dTMP kinase [Oligosphaeraceae bacterium]
MSPNLFITFEGADKAGKSTQILRLEERLLAAGKSVLRTREPGGTPLGEELRSLVMVCRQEKLANETELLLFAASRAQLLRETIWPALQEGKTVLCDRFADSTTAYQGFARGMDRAFLETLHQFTVGGRWPDLTFLLDLPVEESFRRLHRVLQETHGENDRFEEEGRLFHQRVREGFLAVAQANPQRVVVLDATRPPEELSREIWETVQRRMAL